MREPIAIVNIVIIAVTSYVTYRAFKDASMLRKYMFSTETVLGRREYYRLFSSALIHADWGHLFFNMFSLYSFGRFIEVLYGPGTLVVIYLSSIVGGNLLSLYLHRNHEYRALGASGGVCGVIFAAIFLIPGGSVYVFPLPVAIPTSLYAVLFILISFFGIKSRMGNIGHDAHLGGAIVGLLVTTVLHPGIVSESPVLYLIVIGLSSVLLLYLYRTYGLAGGVGSTERKGWGDLLKGRRGESDQGRSPSDDEVLDRLLAKIKERGLDSLTRRERKQLEKLSRKRSGRE
ncbi:MAG: rhomboid family intramembrane serine protease [bacterium]